MTRQKPPANERPSALCYLLKVLSSSRRSSCSRGYAPRAPHARYARFALALVAASAALLACNAIIGVEDVTARTKKGTTDAGNRGCDPDVADCNTPGPLRDGQAPLPGEKGALALGYNHSCARMPDKTVRCWGDNGGGQLGDSIPFDGSRPDVLKPQPVPGIDDAIAIASGLSHTCVVHEKGTVSCWGINSFGQLGDGTKERSSKPVDVVGLTDATALAGGTSFMCALRKDKTVVCWGANYSGQLGDGLKTNERLTVEPVKALSGVTSITAASDHACAVLENGDVMCWGRNVEGQLGTGDTDDSLTPVKLNALSGIVQVAAAARFSCALDKTGHVSCWGKNDVGQLGTGSPNASANPSPSVIPSIADATFIWTGFEHTCVARKTGKISCWGSGGNGQLGKGSVPADASAASPVDVVGAGPALAVWTGGTRSCSIATNGQAFCWGSNTLGQLGNGSTETAYTAVQVSNFP
jgi:alpha-tubulin suppressor-like RCC1 family protein